MFKLVGKHTTATVMIDAVEPQCVAQITEFINHKAFSNPISIMPDTHNGKGAPIGFTMPMTPLIIPNLCGVDIGCGLLSWNFGKLSNLNLSRIEYRIRDQIPFGFEINDKPVINVAKEYDWAQVRSRAQSFAVAYQNKFGGPVPPPPHYDIEWLMKKCADIGCDPKRALNSLSSTGSGNHFHELGIDLNDSIYRVS
jgi:RNA-splicing ligase RtcB